MATNKAAALAKFLKRKLENGEGTTLNPRLVEMAVKNAKESLNPGVSKMVWNLETNHKPLNINHENTSNTMKRA